MEGLILILAELVAVALVPLIAAVVQALAALCLVVFEAVGLALSLLGGAAAKKQAAEETEKTEETTDQRPRRRRWRKVLVGVVGVVALVLLLINTVFFDSLVRYGLKKAAGSTGIELTSQKAEGNLLTGRIELSGVRAVRTGSQKTDLDIDCETLAVDLDMLSVAFGKLTFSEVHIKGLKGSLHRFKSPEEETRQRRAFTVEHLLVEDAALVIREEREQGGDPRQLDVVVDRWETQPFRSTWAAFDFLFRSNVSGKLNGQPFEVTTEEVSDGRKTRWIAKDVPVALLREHIGGPFGWFESGTVDVEVIDEWGTGDAAEIKMHWSITIKDPKVALPEDSGVFVSTVGRAFAAYVESKGEELPIGFDVVLDRNTFEGAATADAAGLWKTVSDGFVEYLEKQFGLPDEDVREKGRSLLDKMKGHLDRRREGD